VGKHPESVRKVLVVTQWPECGTLSIVYSLNVASCEVHLLCLGQQKYLPDNVMYLNLTGSFARNIYYDLQSLPPAKWDHIIFETAYYPPHNILLPEIAALSDCITLVVPSLNFRSGLRQWKAAMGHLVRFWPLWRKRPAVCLNEVMGRLDPRRIFARVCNFLGVDVHFSFLTNSHLYELIYSPWSVSVKRRCRVNFVGKAAPEERAEILLSAREVLLTHGLTPVADTSAPCPWFEVRDGADALSAEQYARLLTESDFTLCPPGYAVWSHRVIESSLRGSIPILDRSTRKLYDIELIDGQNCIIVGANDWPGALNRCLQMSADEVIRMRANLASLHSGILGRNAIAAAIASRLLGH
jgi:hypothetical protein